MADKKNLIVDLSFLLGIISFLGVIIVTSSIDIAIGEFSYQEFCFGCVSVFFVFCSFAFLIVGSSHFSSLVSWSLILWAGVETVWGIMQILGLLTSNHSLYLLTGSFYNPGPYSGYLAMVFPLCLHTWMDLKKRTKFTWMEQCQHYISQGVMFLIICVLPAGMSRSAWIAAAISGIWVYGMHASWGTLLKEWGRQYKKRIWTVLIAGGIMFIVAGYSLFQLKVDSANGRLFMWKVSCLAIMEKPFLGYGFKGFASAYGAAQESYFSQGDYSGTEELVAGSPEYAFNEYLQVAIEYGLPFLFVVVLLIGFCLWIGISEKRIGVCGGVISVLVFAFSSYPLQIPGFAIAFYFLLAACVIGRSKISFVLFVLIIALLGGYYLKNNQYEDCKKWYNAKMIYNIGAYRSAKEEYEKLYFRLKNRGAFLFEYGHCLHKLKEYDASTRVLKEAMAYSNDTMILNVIGKNYQSMGAYEKAEEWLIRSTHRLPGRIYPYYLLAKLYAEPEYMQPEKLKNVIEVVLTKEPKVQSMAVKEMREEVKNYQKLVK